MKFGVWSDLRNPPRWHQPYDELYRETLASDRLGRVRRLRVGPGLGAPRDRRGLSAVGLPVSGRDRGEDDDDPARLRGPAHPFHHPIRLAEDAAFVDQLSGGRLELGLGLGYRRDEFRALGVPRQERGTRTEELIEIARCAWTGEPFSHRGAALDFDDVIVTPIPFQPGGPPLWLGGATAKAAERAGRLGCHFMPDAYMDVAHYAVYREALAAAGHDPAAFHTAINPTIFVTDDPERGWAEIKEHVPFQYNRYREWFAAGGDTPAVTASSAGGAAARPLSDRNA